MKIVEETTLLKTLIPVKSSSCPNRAEETVLNELFHLKVQKRSHNDTKCWYKSTQRVYRVNKRSHRYDRPFSTSFCSFPAPLRALIPKTAELMTTQSSKTDKTIRTPAMLLRRIWPDKKNTVTFNSLGFNVQWPRRDDPNSGSKASLLRFFYSQFDLRVFSWLHFALFRPDITTPHNKPSIETWLDVS